MFGYVTELRTITRKGQQHDGIFTPCTGSQERSRGCNRQSEGTVKVDNEEIAQRPFVGAYFLYIFCIFRKKFGELGIFITFAAALKRVII